MKDYSISVDTDRYATSILAKYLDTTTVKTITKLYKTNLPSVMILTKADASTSDEQFKKLTREFNIYYIDYIGSLVYFLSTSLNLSFELHKLANFSSNPGKVNFEGLIYLLID